MSRAYRIRVKESLSRHVAVEDGVCSSLELLPILPKERMAELLAAALQARGFERDGSAVRRQEVDETVVEIDLESGNVSVRTRAQAQVELSAERTGMVDRGQATDRERQLREAAQAALQQRAQTEEETLAQHVQATLERKLKELKEELDAVVNQVTGNALKERAAQLGQVEEIHEEANGSLTIKVRV